MNSRSGIWLCAYLASRFPALYATFVPALSARSDASLDHRTVRDGVRERNTQFDQIRASPFERGDQSGRRSADGSPAVR